MLKVLLARGPARFDQVLGAALVYLALSVALLDRAQAESKDFQRAIGQGIAHFEAGRFAEARVQFAEAHALSPSARTLRALGMVEFELHNYVESVRYLEQALSAQMKPLDQALRSEANEFLLRARRETARLRLLLSPPDASLRIDGAATLPTDKPLILKPGAHVVEASAADRQSEQRTLQLAPGEERNLTLSLAPLRVLDTPPSADRSERPLYKNPWLWGGVGVAAVALVTGLVVGLAGRDGTRTAHAYGGDTGYVLSGP